MKKFILTFCFLFIIPAIGNAAVLELRNGKTVSGTIISEDDTQVRIDVGVGTTLTYYRDTIKTLHPDQRTFLWKVADADSCVYILGSIHLGSAKLYPLDQAVEDAFAAADILVVEVDVEALDEHMIQQVFKKAGMFHDGTVLSDVLSPRTMRLFKKRLMIEGMTYEMLSRFKPWFIAAQLTIMQMNRLGFDQDRGVDRHFLRLSRGKKKIEELESFEQQLGFFNSIVNQDAYLLYTLQSLDETEEMLTELIEFWKQGDVKAMEKVIIDDILDEYPETAEVYEKILFNRNKHMVARIEEFLKDTKTYFVVVGAGHLISQKGIIEVLSHRGYSVMQVRQAASVQ